MKTQKPKGKWIAPIYFIGIAIVILFSIFSPKCQAQCLTDYKQPVTSIYLAYQPADHGLGLRVDYLRIGKFNLYSSASYGTSGIYKQYGLKSHMKLTQGIMYRIPDYNGSRFFVTAGINYHDIFGTYPTIYSVDPLIYDNWSYELGVSLKIKWFALGLRTDINRWEPCVDLGYNFKYKKYRRWQ